MEDQQQNESSYDIVTVEKLVAFYAGGMLPKPDDLFRLQTMKGARIYFKFLPDGTPRFYMGATSASRYLMTPYLLRWWADGDGYDARQQEIYDKSKYGSYFHSLIASLASGKELTIKEIRQSFKEYLNINEVSKERHYEYGETMVKDILSYIQWTEDFQVQPLAIEIPLCSDTLGVATLIDWVGMLNDLKFDDEGTAKPQRGRKPKFEKVGLHAGIVDFKTGKKGTYETHIMQLQSNKELFTENFPQVEPIKYYYNLSPKAWRKDTPTYSFTNQTERMNQDRYDALLTLARTDLEGVLNRPITTIEGTLTHGTSAKNLIRQYTIQEIVLSGEWKEFMPKEIPV